MESSRVTDGIRSPEELKAIEFMLGLDKVYEAAPKTVDDMERVHRGRPVYEGSIKFIVQQLAAAREEAVENCCKDIEREIQSYEFQAKNESVGTRNQIMAQTVVEVRRGICERLRYMNRLANRQPGEVGR